VSATVAAAARDQLDLVGDVAFDSPFFNISSMCFWRLAISGTFDVVPPPSWLGAGLGEHPEVVSARVKDRASAAARIRGGRGARTQGGRSLMREPPGVNGVDGADLVRRFEARGSGSRPGRGPEVIRERRARRGDVRDPDCVEFNDSQVNFKHFFDVWPIFVIATRPFPERRPRILSGSSFFLEILANLSRH
jgi:hypothetical protein